MFKEKENELISELKKRLEKLDEEASVLGTELRNRRLSVSRTLNAIAYRICSVSYLSKLEHNKINPNRAYINEISKKLSLSQQSVDILMKSKSLLLEVVEAYLNGNMEVLEKSYNACEGLNNYRMELVRLIVEVSVGHYYDALEICNKLMSLLTSMSEIDLYVFTLFRGIIHFYYSEFKEAIDNLEALRECSINKIMSIIRDKFIFLSYQALNLSGIDYEYNRLVNELLEAGKYEEIEYARYVMAMYLLKNNSKEAYKQARYGLHEVFYVNSLDLMEKYYNHENIDYASIDNSISNNFLIGLKAIYTNDPEVEMVLSTIEHLEYDPGTDYLMLKYISLKTDVDRYNYLIKEVFPRLEFTGEGFLIKYFLNELSRLCQIQGRYKIFSDIYSKFVDIRGI